MVSTYFGPHLSAASIAQGSADSTRESCSGRAIVQLRRGLLAMFEPPIVRSTVVRIKVRDHVAQTYRRRIEDRSLSLCRSREVTVGNGPVVASRRARAATSHRRPIRGLSPDQSRRGSPPFARRAASTRSHTLIPPGVAALSPRRDPRHLFRDRRVCQPAHRWRTQGGDESCGSALHKPRLRPHRLVEIGSTVTVSGGRP